MSTAARPPQKRGAILIMTLILVGFVSAIGLALVITAGSFLQRARLEGQEARARALANGGIAHAIERLRDGSRSAAEDITLKAHLEYRDGVLGEFTVRFDADRGIATSTGTVEGVSKTMVVRFGVQ